MDFQVIPHRKLKKIPLGVSLGVFILAVLILLLQLIDALLMDLGFLPPAPVNTGGVAGVVGAGTLSLIYIRRLRQQQIRLQQAMQDLDLVQLSKDSKVRLFLYLRSFRLGRSTLLHRLAPSAHGYQPATFGGEVFYFEEDISNAINPYGGVLIAIGDRGDSYGAGKIIISDEKWKDHFQQLATHSWMIFVQPDLTQSVRWEIGQLLCNASYLRKTVWVMPCCGRDTWTKIRDGLRQDIGVLLPSHHEDGGMFRLCPDSGDVPVTPTAFTLALTRVLDEASFNGQQLDVEQVWERVLADERNLAIVIGATDLKLREIRREIPLLGWW